LDSLALLLPPLALPRVAIVVLLLREKRLKSLAQTIGRGYLNRHAHAAVGRDNVMSPKRINSLAVAAKAPERVKDLYLLDLRTRTFPDVILSMHNLEQLSIGPGKFASLPEGIGELVKLRHLSLGGIPLGKLPSGIGKLGRLEHLFLEGDELTELPESLGRLAKLRFLSLESNRLTSIPASFVGLESLQELHLAHNKLSEIPACVGGMQSLEHLEATFNPLKRVDPKIGRCKKLKHLSLGESLRELPSQVAELERLEEVILGGNAFEAIPEPLLACASLLQLYMPKNRVSSLRSIGATRSRLQVLGLSRNPLRSLEGVESLRELRELDIRQDAIASLAPLESLPKLARITLSTDAVGRDEVARFRRARPKVKIADG
jgi:Leucine-rich repeat (LRR) protein